MALIYVSLLLIIGAFATADPACSRKVLRNCDPSDIPHSFPENEEELDARCRRVIRFVECGLEVMEDCENSEEEAREINNVLSVIRNICDEDSHLHRVVADNLQCVKPILTRDISECSNVQRNKEKFEKHRDILFGQGFQPLAEDEDNINVCGLALHAAACVGLKIEKKCGSSALDAYIAIVQQISSSFVADCNEEIREYLPAYIEILMLEEAETEEIREAFRRKKK